MFCIENPYLLGCAYVCVCVCVCVYCTKNKQCFAFKAKTGNQGDLKFCSLIFISV